MIEDWNSLKVKSENITQDIIQLFHDDFDTCALNGYYSATYEMRKLATNHVHTVKVTLKRIRRLKFPLKIITSLCWHAQYANNDSYVWQPCVLNDKHHDGLRVIMATEIHLFRSTAGCIFVFASGKRLRFQGVTS